MGDRFTFGVTDRGGDVLYLYSHWGGEDWDKDLKTAFIEASPRIKDVSYGNRIIISHLIGDQWQHTTGFGFSINKVMDTDYGYIPVIDLRNGTVSFYSYNYEGELGDKLVELSINDYLDTKDIYGLLHYAQRELEEAREDVTV